MTNMQIASPPWRPVESRSALVSALGTDLAVPKLLTADANTWGWFELQSGKKLVVGYANIGLQPAAAILGDQLFVGICELLVGLETNSLRVLFQYRMPSVFHEFVSLANSIVVRDEVGFVCVSKEGEEVWRRITAGPIASFSVSGTRISGRTIDDESFEFATPR